MRIAAAALILLFGTAPVYAQEKQFESTPAFDGCGDPSYEKAKSEGVTIAISPSQPFSFLDPKTNEALGIEVEIGRAALNWAGVTKLKYEIMPYGQIIPALLAKRVDIDYAVHITPERKKVISFTGPIYWYGPAIIVKKGSNQSFKSFEDLKGKRIGAIAGSAADEYLRKVGAEVVPFQDDAAEWGSISGGQVEAVVDDDVKVKLFLVANPTAPLEIVPNVPVPNELIFTYGYGYVRSGLRKEDCSLRAAYTQGIAEVRANGTVSEVLKKYGLSNDNLFYFPIK
jgi:polar amino acid transport system substrate-binding protein